MPLETQCAFFGVSMDICVMELLLLRHAIDGVQQLVADQAQDAVCRIQVGVLGGFLHNTTEIFLRHPQRLGCLSKAGSIPADRRLGHLCTVGYPSDLQVWLFYSKIPAPSSDAGIDII